MTPRQVVSHQKKCINGCIPACAAIWQWQTIHFLWKAFPDGEIVINRQGKGPQTQSAFALLSDRRSDMFLYVRAQASGRRLR